MKNLHLLQIRALIAIACITFTACDPTYNVEFQVQNSSRQQLTIHSRQVLRPTIDTNIISPGTKLTLYVEWGIGSTTKSYMERLQGLPFEISIFNREGQHTTRDVQNFSQWQKFYTDKRNDLGVVQLTMRPGDF